MDEEDFFSKLEDIIPQKSYIGQLLYTALSSEAAARWRDDPNEATKILQVLVDLEKLDLRGSISNSLEALADLESSSRTELQKVITSNIKTREKIKPDDNELLTQSWNSMRSALSSPEERKAPKRKAIDEPSSSKKAREKSRGKIYSFYTHKGGVGKTTSLTHMAIKAVQEDKKVLVIDSDPQMNSTNFFFGYGENTYDFDEYYSSLVSYHTAITKPPKDRTEGDHKVIDTYKFGAGNVWDLIREINPDLGVLGTLKAHNAIGFEIKTEGPGSLRLLASHPMFGEIEADLAREINDSYHRPDHSTRFKKIADFLIDKYSLDLVLVDLSPSSSFLNQNIVLSSDFIILPCSADEYAYYTIKTIGMWLSAWKVRHAGLNLTPKILTIVYNKYKRHSSKGKGEKSRILIGDRTVHTSAAHKDYIMRLISKDKGAIAALVDNNPEFIVRYVDYFDIPLICDALSTASMLSSKRRTCYDTFTDSYSSSDRTTCQQLRREYDFFWSKIASTFDK